MEYGAIGHRLATAQRMLCYLPFIFIPTHPREKRSRRKLNLIRISILQIRILFLFLVKLFTLTQNMIRKIHAKIEVKRTRKKSDNNKKFTKSLLKTNIQREINQNEQIEFQLERFVAVFFFLANENLLSSCCSFQFIRQYCCYLLIIIVRHISLLLFSFVVHCLGCCCFFTFFS